MFALVIATIAILYFSYKAILHLPKGKEEPLTADELEWYMG